MSNVCKIYYGTVVSGEGDNWIKKGSHQQEPIKVEDRDPLGKPPEFCCKEFGEARDHHILYFDSEQLTMRLNQSPGMGSRLDLKACFCPFCGANIILREDLKLRVVKTTHTTASYYLEKAV